jgi:hypothetical protein
LSNFIPHAIKFADFLQTTEILVQEGFYLLTKSGFHLVEATRKADS